MVETASDEVDLLELIQTLWEEKWMIVTITLFFSFMSVIVALQMSTSFDGYIRVTALSKQQMAAYQLLNNTLGVSRQSQQNEAVRGDAVRGDELFHDFLGKIRQGSTFASAHLNLDPAVKNFTGTPEELERLLAKIGQGYEFTADEKVTGSGKITFQTNNRDLTLSVLKEALAAANEEIRAENLAGINNLRTAIEISLSFELAEVNKQIKNELNIYEIQTAARRALLKEQAAIARQLGNANGEAVASGGSGINVAVEQKQPLYIRGYKALEKEIELIDMRGKGGAAYPYVENYASLAAKKLELESDQRLQRISTGLAQTPLSNSNNFLAANYDLKMVTFQAKSYRRLVVILATLLGGFFAAFFVLTRKAIINRQQFSDA